MFIKTKQHNILESACGVQIFFDRLLPKPKKIANITTVNRSNGLSTLVLSNITDPIEKGDKIRVAQVTGANFSVVPVPDSFLGDFTVQSASIISGSRGSITFEQNLLNSNNFSVTGDLYQQANITPSEQYVIEFSVETKVPSSTEVILRPQSYIINGYEEFTPTIILETKLQYSRSAKILLKMIVKDFKSNSILKTEYQEIIITDSSGKPCEIIYDKPITTTYYELNTKNNWSYYYEGYLLAEFIPNNKNENIILQLIKKNDQILPSRGGKNKIKIVVDPIKLQNKKVTLDKIRSAIIKQYDTINNSIAIANLGNKSYDIIVEDKLIKPSDFNDIVVDIVPPETGVPVKFSEVATASLYGQDIFSIPKISILRWNKNNNIKYLGELHYNEQIYDRDTLLVTISGTGLVNLSGIIMDVTNGINYLNEY